MVNLTQTKFSLLKMSAVIQRRCNVVTIAKKGANVTCCLTSILKNEEDPETQDGHWKLKLFQYCQKVTNANCLVILEKVLSLLGLFSTCYKVNLYIAPLNFYPADFSSPKFKKKKRKKYIELLPTSSWLDLECMHNLSWLNILPH